MAAVSAWGKPGAWAAAVEDEENEIKDRLPSPPALPADDPAADFPTLADAAATKTKKKKAQTLSLAEFNSGTIAGSAYRAPAPSDEILQLPTGPREHTAEELERSNSRGFGCSSYGARGGSGLGGSARASDEPRRNGFGGGGANRELGPSRADEVDDWGSGKKSAAALERRRDLGFFDSQSRADESESWVSNKSTSPPPSTNGRRSHGGGYFNKEALGGRSGADSDTWGKKGDDVFNKDASGGRSAAGSHTWGKKREEGSSGGRLRLVLQPRSLPLADGNNGESAAKSKGANPFGEARPREEVLAEKGQDWKEIDEKLESMKIREAPVEGTNSGRKGLGTGNGSGVDRTERSWRKADNGNVDTPSPARVEEVEEASSAS